MEPLFARLTNQQLNIYRLVLDASGIPSRATRRPTGWVMEIPRTHRASAITAIRLYIKENAGAPPLKRLPASGGLKTFSAGYVTAALVALNLALRSGFERNLFIQIYGADAAAILDGQLYRCVTALLFHADWAHLTANAVGLLVFGTAVAVAAGPGIGWLLILLCGAGGNLLTALWYGEGHISIGASTAVFASVGLCSAFTVVLHLRQKDGLRRAWLPMAAGLALLGFVGASPNADLLAHLFGFGCGLAIGVLFAWRIAKRLPWQIQLPAFLVLVGMVGASWIAGMQS
jgi:membrane associated rhomboid family serine protease